MLACANSKTPTSQIRAKASKLLRKRFKTHIAVDQANVKHSNQVGDEHHSILPTLPHSHFGR